MVLKWGTQAGSSSIFYGDASKRGVVEDLMEESVNDQAECKLLSRACDVLHCTALHCTVLYCTVLSFFVNVVTFLNNR